MSSDLYRIDLSPTYGKPGGPQRPLYGQADIDEWIADGVLVKVEPCVHGRIEGHYVNGTILPADDAWCPGGGCPRVSHERAGRDLGTMSTERG